MNQQAVSYKAYEATDKNSPIKKSVDSGRLVIIEDYIPGTHTLKIKDYKTGKPVRGPLSSPEKVIQSKVFEQNLSMTLKTLPTQNGPIVEVNDGEASIRGSSTNGLYSSKDFGNIVKGPTSFSAQPHEMRVGGLQTFHPLLTSGFPSTIVTPIPVFQWSLPSAAMLGPIAKDVALMATLIGIIA